MLYEEGYAKYTRYRLEYAASSRSKCIGPTPCCGAPIAQDTIRVGTLVDMGWGTTFQWCHFGCLTAKLMENVLKSAGSIEDIEGYDDLEPEDQERVKKAFETEEIDRADVPESAKKAEGAATEVEPEEGTGETAAPQKCAPPQTTAAETEMQEVGVGKENPTRTHPTQTRGAKNAEGVKETGDASEVKTEKKPANRKRKAATKKAADDDDYDDKTTGDGEGAKAKKRVRVKLAEPAKDGEKESMDKKEDEKPKRKGAAKKAVGPKVKAEKAPRTNAAVQ